MKEEKGRRVLKEEVEEEEEEEPRLGPLEGSASASSQKASSAPVAASTQA